MMRDIDDRRANLERYLVDWARWVASWRPRIGTVSASFMFSSGGRGYDSAEEYLSDSDRWAMETIDSAVDALESVKRNIIHIEFSNRAFGAVFTSVRLPTCKDEYEALLASSLDDLIGIAMRKGLPL